MKTAKWFVPSMVAAALLALSALMPTPVGASPPPPPPGQTVKRVASNFTAFDGTQININADALDGGVEIYDQTVKSTAGANVLYVTVQGTAHNETCPDDPGTGIAANCQVDGVNCNSGFGIDEDEDALPPGWIEVTGTTNVFDDVGWTAFSYTWCTPIDKTKGNLHVVELFAATDEDESGCSNIIQTVSVNVDANKFNKANKELGNACASYANPNPTTDF